MISSTSLPKKWLTSSSRGTQSRKSNNIFKKVMLHVLPEIIDKFIISQNRKEKNKKRKKEHVPYGCAQFFISISEIKVIKNRQRPTFPGSFPPSIIGAKELNYCVRDGNRCILPAIVTGLRVPFVPSKLKSIKSYITQTIGQVFDLLVSVS